MSSPRKFKNIIIFIVLITLLVVAIPLGVMADSHTNGLPPNTEFYVAKHNHGAIEQIADLTSSGDKASADLIRAMIKTPQAVWFTKGTPKQTQQAVKNTVKRAAGKGTVPVLVAYNIPFRDCAQFSAGGATTVEEYKAWIDGFAKGIGKETAVVILEPDGLGIIPWYKQFRGLDSEAEAFEWCQPAEADEGSAADERFEMLNYAVDAFKAQPHTVFISTARTAPGLAPVMRRIV